ncbi:hypothetical protein GJ698_07110 [Pseudoduganella sp. FT26W]|uniref:Uncharacterized protein n=1 Tax=Duganella aquatilis TaxID=2666082 RepID=A0A844D9W9_9BURK|nr:hypothetical protein [Duganella aquatilis]MRW83864.1 hypothetical protein [Duganella aquatilis]
MKLSMLVTMCVLSVVSIAVSITGSAAEFKKLDGTYAITGRSLIDPPSGEKEDRVVFIVEGRAAKDIYNGIQALPQKSACDSKVYLKTAQSLACTKDGKLYR